jgi:hypothetical protein
MATSQAQAEFTDLEEPLAEYVRLVASVRVALQQRQEKRTAYIATLTDLEAKQSAYNKVANAAGKEDQARSKLALVQRAQQAAEEAKEDYDRVSQRIIIEFEIFKKQKVVDFRDVLLNFVCLQANFARQAEQLWCEVIPDFEKVSTVPPGTLVRVGEAGSNISKPSPIYGTGASPNIGDSPTSTAFSSSSSSALPRYTSNTTSGVAADDAGGFSYASIYRNLSPSKQIVDAEEESTNTSKSNNGTTNFIGGNISHHRITPSSHQDHDISTVTAAAASTSKLSLIESGGAGPPTVSGSDGSSLLVGAAQEGGGVDNHNRNVSV